jgi:uncharacterized protein YdhG (YjbR/CyaY superfamily)
MCDILYNIQTLMDSIDKYISAFPEEVQKLLVKIRITILKSAPGATESISYGMPAYKIKGKPLVYFAAFKNHIGFYATPTGHKEFEKDLSVYKQGKGSVQFPLEKPVPFELIGRITRFRVEENLKYSNRKR